VQPTGADSLLVISSRADPALLRQKSAQHAQERRLPVIASWREFAEQRCFVVLRAESDFRAKRLAAMCKRFEWRKASRFAIELPVKSSVIQPQNRQRPSGSPITAFIAGAPTR